MPSETYLVDPKPAPNLNFPSSSSTVIVRIINTTSYVKGSTRLILDPHIPGHDEVDCPCFSFLVTNAQGSRHVLFDLGIRKDFETGLAPTIMKLITGDKPLFGVNVERNVADILDEDSAKLGTSSKDIEAVIWCHHHWDHIGDMTTFPSSTELVVGPGFKAQYLPGYPKNPESPLCEADFEGRNVREVNASSFSFKIGQFPAFDYFGDGSFYLLHSPGHTVGHICGLARVTPETFIFMGGDCCHHGGEFRPTEYLPLPKYIAPAPMSRFGHAGCPGAYMVEHVHPKRSATQPFYDIAQGFSHDHDEAVRSIRKLEEFDASDDVLMCIAHDQTLLGNVAFYPETINDWKVKGYGDKVRWAFCGDFKVEPTKGDGK
jgi:glyoxylase-like metal-dependent hydrolase (beta-lactamase superfamily II)